MTIKNTNSSSTKSSTSSSAIAAPVTTPVAPMAAAPVSGQTTITSADAAQCQALLSQVGDILGPVTVLSADQIRRSLKLRKGGSQVVPQLVDLCRQHGITSVGPVTPESLSAQKARADTLNTIGVTLAALGKKLGDATFSAESDTWQQATTLYTVLQRLAVFNPTLAQGMQPVQAFFQTKKTRGKERTAEVERRLTSEEKVAAKHEPSASGAPSTTSAPAPAAVTPAATNGVARS